MRHLGRISSSELALKIVHETKTNTRVGIFPSISYLKITGQMGQREKLKLSVQTTK